MFGIILQGAVHMPSGSPMADSPISPFQQLAKKSEIGNTSEHLIKGSALRLLTRPSPFNELEEAARILFPQNDRCELPSISDNLLFQVLTGERGFTKDHVVILDTRHNFEYVGGHIQGALNINDPNGVEEFFSNNLARGKELVVIFHCEFSSVRAPKLFRHMRNIDRQQHIEVYPELGFPHMYMLHGGYKAFFEGHADLCCPRAYVRMVDPLHIRELRISNKLLERSWNARSRHGEYDGSQSQEVASSRECDPSHYSRPCSTRLTFGR